jgi:hypothetical protein
MAGRVTPPSISVDLPFASNYPQCCAHNTIQCRFGGGISSVVAFGQPIALKRS